MNKRIKPLDGVRGIAILLVCFHHLFDLKMGWIGVEFFFVLSGFLITSVLIQREDDPDRMRFFYVRRAKRILPLLIVAVLLESVWHRGFWLHNWYWYTFFLMNVRETVRSVTWLRNLWSLAVEEHFYLVWPALFFALSRRRAVQVLIAVLLISPVLRLIFTSVFNGYMPIYFLTPFRLDGLAAGALLSILTEQGKLKVKNSVLLTGLALSLPVAYLMVHFIPGFYREANSRLFNSVGYSLVTLVAAIVVLLAYSAREGMIGKILSFKPLMFMGTISYFVYIFHSLTHYIPIHNPHLKGLAGFCVFVLAGSISWYWFEKPILRTTFWEARPARGEKVGATSELAES